MSAAARRTASIARDRCGRNPVLPHARRSRVLPEPFSGGHDVTCCYTRLQPGTPDPYRDSEGHCQALCHGGTARANPGALAPALCIEEEVFQIGNLTVDTR